MSQCNSLGTQGPTPEETAEEAAETTRRRREAERPDGLPWLTNLGSMSSYLLGVGGSALLFFGPPALRRHFWLWWLPVFLLLLVPREGMVGRVVMKVVGLVALALMAWSAWSSWSGPGSTAHERPTVTRSRPFRVIHRARKDAANARRSGGSVADSSAVPTPSPLRIGARCQNLTPPGPGAHCLAHSPKRRRVGSRSA